MKKIWKDQNAVSPVIAVILMVAITVVLAAVLYVMVSGMLTTTSTTPTAGLTMNPGSTTNSYQGNLVSPSKSVPLEDITVTLWDDSAQTANSGVLTNGDTTVAVGSGINMTYRDTVDNDKIDGGDVITAGNVGTGDSIKFIYEPTGGVIAEKIF